MIEFSLGVASSIVASAILYLLRYQIGHLLNLVFLHVFPAVSGKYIMVPIHFKDKDSNSGKTAETGSSASNHTEKKAFPGNTHPKVVIEDFKLHNPNAKCRVLVLKQFGNRLRGEIIQPTGTGLKEVEKVSGRITPTRVIILNSESRVEDHHNFCTYLITLENDKKYLAGSRSALCLKCGGAYSHYLFFEKVEG